jgi:hypothetical protein
MTFQKGHEVSPEIRQKIRLAHLGKKKSPEHVINNSLAKLGEKNPHWKGDKVGNRELHRWVRRHLPAPDLCQHCKIKPPADLANITGIYEGDFKNWSYLCRKCHIKQDGRKTGIALRRSKIKN